MGRTGWSVYFVVEDIDDLHAFHHAQGVHILAPPADQPWGLREYAVHDLYGHTLRFGQHLQTTEPSLAIERVDVSVRLERRLAAALNDLAAYKRMTLGECLEETLLHTFEKTADGGVPSPHTQRTLDRIQELKQKHGIDYDCHASYRFVEKRRLPPMGQHAFVGRREELEQLVALCQRAAAGHGGVALVSGEAGIGKSALLRALAGQAADALVLTGACHDGEGAPPFGPWSEALFELLPRFEAPLGPGETRQRRFDAVVRRLLEAARERPVLVLLDDLHWADRDSLDLLAHVVRFVARGRIALVGAYRDREPGVDAAHPLAALIATLVRRDDCVRVPLRALDLAEAQALLAQAAGTAVPQGLARALVAESSGNAFYLLELLRHLLEEHRLERRGTALTFDASIAALGIPAGVRAVLAHRLARLSHDSRRVLTLGSALAGGFSLAHLARMSDLGEERLLAALDQALAAGLLLAGERGRYVFAHAIVRRALEGELGPDRRARLQRAAAEALLADASQDPGRAAELAALYHRSRHLPGAPAGVPHALAAAEAARAAGALDGAVAFLRMARDLGAPPADVLTRLALAEAAALRFDDACASTAAALAAMSEASIAREAQADLLARVAHLLRVGGAPPAQVAALAARGLALVGETRGLAWARLMLLGDRIEPVLAGPVYVGRFVPPDPAAVALLRARGDEDDIAATIDPYDVRRRDETDQLLARTRGFQSRAAAVQAGSVLVRDYFFRHHDLRAALAGGRELLAEAEQLGQIPAQAVALSLIGCSEVALGQLGAARTSSSRLDEVAERLGAHHRMQLVAPLALRVMLAYYVGGDWPTLLAPLHRMATDPATLATPLGLVTGGLTVLVLSQLGERDEAARLLAGLARAHRQGPPSMVDWGPSRGCAAAAVWHLGLVALADTYRELALDPAAEAAGAAPFDCRELIVARMAALAGDLDEAEVWFERARRVLDTLGLLPVRALADLDQAIALERREPERARELAATALARFERLGMTPWIERARALLGEPAAAPAALSARELDVLRQLAGGASNKEIASALAISVATVERHIANIYDKIGVRGRANATAFALRHKL